VLLADKAIIIISRDIDSPLGSIEFYATLLYFLKKGLTFSHAYALFQDPYSDLRRKKIRSNFLSNVEYYNIISFLEGDNLEAYYQNRHEIELFFGIELRFDEDLELEDKETLFLELVKEIREQKKKIFEV
jgi:hypothetical protein